MSRIKKGPKRKKPGKPTQTQKSLGERLSKHRQRALMTVTCLAVALAAVLALGVSAKNLLFSDPDIKAVSEKVQEQIREYNKTNASNLSKAHSTTATEKFDKLAGLPIGASLELSLTPSFSGPRNYKWDAENRLIEIDYPGSGNSSTFTYDGFGHWVKIVETVGGTVTSTKQFVWAGDRPVEERDASGIVTKRFFNNGEQISGTNYSYTLDHLGSVREMTDGSGNVVAQYSYEPFGRTTKVQGSLDSDFQYAGMYRHATSGLYLAVHRVYNPVLGRWLNRDPMDDPTFAMMPQSPEPQDSSAFGQPGAPANPNMLAIQSATHDPMLQSQLMKIMPHSPALSADTEQTNPYIYANNNPINITDTSGLGVPNPWKWWKKWCRCREGCRVTQDFAYNTCIRSGKPPLLCKAIADGAYHSCVAGCMANPDTPSP